MRGLGRVFKRAVFIAGLLGVSASALAATDPRTPVVLEYYVASNGTVLNSVTVSRDGLPTLAAYQFTLTNKAATDLGRLRFTATLTTTAASGGDNGTWNTFYIVALSPLNGSGFGSCTGMSTAVLHCDSDISLPGTTYDSNGNPIHAQITVLLVANTPYSGSSLKATVTAGGHEGNSTAGNGCCENPSSPQTLAIQLNQPESSTNTNAPPYTSYALTFLKGQETGKVFTGKKAVTSTSDPFASAVTAPPFAPTSVQYSLGEIIEQPATDTTNCKGGNRFKSCYQSRISLPNVSYVNTTDPVTPANICSRTDVLSILLRIDSSLIKGNPTPDLTQIAVWYTPDGATTKELVKDCTAADAALPCVCSRYQWTDKTAVGYTPDLKNDIDLLIKNVRNGLLEFD